MKENWESDTSIPALEDMLREIVQAKRNLEL